MANLHNIFMKHLEPVFFFSPHFFQFFHIKNFGEFFYNQKNQSNFTLGKKKSKILPRKKKKNTTSNFENFLSVFGRHLIPILSWSYYYSYSLRAQAILCILHVCTHKSPRDLMYCGKNKFKNIKIIIIIIIRGPSINIH